MIRERTVPGTRSALQEGVRVNRVAWAAALVIFCGPTRPALAHLISHPFLLARVSRRIQGQVVDYTHNHGKDRRIWSSALNQPRDLYVYLPPGFDPYQCYPLILWLHGFAQDEQSFLKDAVEPLDRAIVDGRLPPAIIVAPDGSFPGEPCILSAGSFFLNSKAGRFEDFVMQDVWPFMLQNYPIRPEREAHVIAGASMGGGAAFNLGIKYRDCFGIVLGIFPPLNTRWIDCHGRYMRNFDPACWGWRTDFSHGREVVGRFYGVVTIRLRHVVTPLYGRAPNTAELVSRENPIEMLDSYCVQPGDLSMFVGYAGRDQFNIDAQVESFLFAAKERGLSVAVAYDPRGKHDLPTALKLLPAVLDWLGPQLAPFAPYAMAGPRCAKSFHFRDWLRMPFGK
jgi:S-formylglutathione hydrolase FrmB